MSTFETRITSLGSQYVSFGGGARCGVRLPKRFAAPLGRRIIVAARARSLFFLARILVGCVALACASTTETGPRPKPALSSDSRAQVRFRELSDRWHAASPERRLQLEAPLRQFLAEFPYDGLRRPAWVYLAWILVQKGDLMEARELVDRVRSGPPGAVNDLAVVTEAALLLQLNQPQDALRLVRPVRGKLIDPVERFLLTEQLVSAAIGANLHSEAILYMVDWAAQAPVTQRQAVREAIESRLHQTPRRYLERALVEFESGEEIAGGDPVRHEQQEWLENAIARRLKALAVEERDVELARLVLEHNPGLGGDRDAAEELMALATENESRIQIDGRTIGLLLSTATGEQRLRSNEVVSAVALTLGLPRSASEAGAVRLVFAEDPGGAGDAERAFASLSSQGASVLIGGVDADTAKAHARVAEKSSVPLLSLHPHDLDRPEFSFTVGVSRLEEQRVIEEELRARGVLTSVALTKDHQACAAGFNVSAKSWLGDFREEGFGALLLMGGQRCAERFLDSRVRREGLLLVFGLEEALLAVEGDAAGTLWLRAGRFPFQAEDPRIEGWMTRQRALPSWFQALGHDAAAIARWALDALPDVTASEQKAVLQYRNEVRAKLRRLGGVELWSTDVARFDSELSLDRRFHFAASEP